MTYFEILNKEADEYRTEHHPEIKEIIVYSDDDTESPTSLSYLLNWPILDKPEWVEQYIRLELQEK